MASRIEYRYNPIDLDKNRAVGILLPFGGYSGVNYNFISSSNISGSNLQNIGGKSLFKSSYTTEQQAISNLKGLLLTTKGERPFQPLFGANIYSLLFENIDDDLGSALENSLTEDIGFWLPYILLDGVEVNTEPDYNRVSIKVRFRVTEQGANQTIILEVDGQGGLSIV